MIRIVAAYCMYDSLSSLFRQLVGDAKSDVEKARTIFRFLITSNILNIYLVPVVLNCST